MLTKIIIKTDLLQTYYESILYKKNDLRFLSLFSL